MPDLTLLIGLIETWDVLKSELLWRGRTHWTSLIETWDVLKLRNFERLYTETASLIETWDVLKYNIDLPVEDSLKV